VLPISPYPSRQSGHQQHRGFPTYFCYNLSLELIARLSLASQREVALNIYRCRVSDQLEPHQRCRMLIYLTLSAGSQYKAANIAPLIKSPSLWLPKPVRTPNPETVGRQMLTHELKVEFPMDVHPLPDDISAYVSINHFAVRPGIHLTYHLYPIWRAVTRISLSTLSRSNRTSFHNSRLYTRRLGL
jgi:hypothetical protein